jgi:RNA polymerase sigma-70 factor, ECF subfamily
MESTDPALVEATMNGQPQAFTELVRRYQDSVFNLSYRMSGNWHDAADTAQETFIRAFRKLSYYDPRYSFRNWVMSICANLTKNRFRGEARRRTAESAHTDLEFLGRSARPDPRRGELDEALLKVPDSLRLPLILKHVEGFSYEEIAETLGVGLSAAKMRVQRGRDELVRLLASGPGGSTS